MKTKNLNIKFKIDCFTFLEKRTLRNKASEKTPSYWNSENGKSLMIFQNKALVSILEREKLQEEIKMARSKDPTRNSSLFNILSTNSNIFDGASA